MRGQQAIIQSLDVLLLIRVTEAAALVDMPAPEHPPGNDRAGEGGGIRRGAHKTKKTQKLSPKCPHLKVISSQQAGCQRGRCFKDDHCRTRATSFGFKEMSILDERPPPAVFPGLGD